jgi:hypothetical protein
MSKKNENDFLKLVEENPCVITDKDLETLLEKRLEIPITGYFSAIALSVSVIITLLTLRWFVLDISSIYGTIATFVSFFIIASLFYLYWTIRRMKPFENQKRIMEQYLEAKKRLKELQLKSTEK